MIKILKLILKAGNKKFSSSVNSILGQNRINVKKFSEKFCEISSNFNKNFELYICLKIYNSKKYSIFVKPPLTSFLINYYSKSNAIDKKSLKKIFDIKKKVFNTRNKIKAFNIILGTAKSMGIKFKSD